MSSLLSSTRAGIYLRFDHQSPSPGKAYLRIRVFKRTERPKTVANPHAKAPSGARVNLSEEPSSEHQHTLHIISLALLPRTRASQTAGTPG